MLEETARKKLVGKSLRTSSTPLEQFVRQLYYTNNTVNYFCQVILKNGGSSGFFRLT
jgi:hypothetical protein